jgi:hypothetical protein
LGELAEEQQPDVKSRKPVGFWCRNYKPSIDFVPHPAAALSFSISLSVMPTKIFFRTAIANTI